MDKTTHMSIGMVMVYNYGSAQVTKPELEQAVADGTSILLVMKQLPECVFSKPVCALSRLDCAQSWMSRAPSRDGFSVRRRMLHAMAARQLGHAPGMTPAELL